MASLSPQMAKDSIMWRALFLALGIYSCVLGAECLLIDNAIVSSGAQASAVTRVAQTVTGRQQEVIPPPWAPWSLMSAGAVVILYSFSLPQKMKG